jgi:hypothetical protein
MEQERQGGRPWSRAHDRNAGQPAPVDIDAHTGDPAWGLVLQCLRDIAGFERGVIYDVPRNQAPETVQGTPVFLRGSPAWSSYLRSREVMDDGTLSVILSLRPLDNGERRLVVDWGATYANAFLLVEPFGPRYDLTVATQGFRRELECIAERAVRRPGRNTEPEARTTAELRARLREAYGIWVSWTGPLPDGAIAIEPFRLEWPGETIAGALRPMLRARFPDAAFDAALAGLHEAEPELFSGRTVDRVRMPFLTRLGLPVPYEPELVERALRRLVNAGSLWVYERGPEAVSYHGPSRPVPEEMPSETFRTLVL